MSLTEYNRKRNFRKTSEPAGGKKSKGKPIFVVQKHWASHLHYDFRLEAFGTLKSWAVPKGPPMEPKQKRLAVQVEDHPLDYAKFEGDIPKGEYGAGHVEIWDHGTWTPPKNLREALQKGRLDFELDGEKLKGKWLLQRTRQNSGGKAQWLLIKRTDSMPVAVKAEPLSEIIEPKLAVLVERVPQGNQWLHEIKLDGYRTFCYLQNNKAKLLTRSGKDWTEKYEPIRKSVEKIRASNAILDGEIVCLDENGKSNFQGLQTALKNKDFSRMVYYVFDLLFLNGEDLRSLALADRKAKLQKLMKTQKLKNILYSQHSVGNGKELFELACKEGLEGIVSKDGDGAYTSGRDPDWQKIKCSQRQEMVIGGYTDPKGERAGFGALLMGVYENGKLRYIGKVGTGFTHESNLDVFRKLKKLEQESTPFEIGSPRAKDIHWVKPSLVGEVEFKTWTEDKHLRQASFQGLRLDKPAQEITFERPGPVKPTTEFKISHPERMLYPTHKVTKLDVANYYNSISKWILPHMMNRPLALLRCTKTAGSHCFIQKHIEKTSLRNVKEHEINRDGKPEKVIYLDSSAGLLDLVQWGALEFHGWGTHVSHALNPDLIVFDLDPDIGVPWKKIVDTAFHIRDLCQRLDLESFVKTTGGKGLHVEVPILPLYTWEQVKAFSKTLMQQMEHEYPNLYTSNLSKATRKNKIFLDYLRNGYGANAVLPYSLRSKDKPSVAVPLTWDELKKVKSADAFTLEKTLLRLAGLKKDPWEGFLKLKQKISILESVNSRSRKARPTSSRAEI